MELDPRKLFGRLFGRETAAQSSVAVPSVPVSLSEPPVHEPPPVATPPQLRALPLDYLFHEGFCLRMAVGRELVPDVRKYLCKEFHLTMFGLESSLGEERMLFGHPHCEDLVGTPFSFVYHNGRIYEGLIAEAYAETLDRKLRTVNGHFYLGLAPGSHAKDYARLRRRLDFDLERMFSVARGYSL